jgi:FtsP/CotA-like multicopper oxidase with cupredoxin domain
MVACSGGGGEGDPCEIEDQDGVIGGESAFVVRVYDTEFDPPTLTAQNRADVRLTLENESSGDAGFHVDCLPTRNDEGCPQESCFPGGATIAPIAPGESTTVEFRLPAVEGTYFYRPAPGDDRTGELVLR